jgi:hypothetical protein
MGEKNETKTNEINYKNSLDVKGRDSKKIKKD